MALTGKWIDRRDGIDPNSADDINQVAHAVMELEGGSGGKISPQAYGAIGDGLFDDTKAFEAALNKNRVVFVPGGTYKLSGELVIRDNCEMELAQDAVLMFTQVEGNCITLNMSSSLRGNHATIKVPYEFDGNVIYASTTTADSVVDMPPFTRWDPQWKTGRYVTDLNICKADSRGFHYSLDGTCTGTAVYLSADGEAVSTFMWGVHYSGLRIAGAFEYGIRAVNFNEGWNHEMRIEALIDACEIGVSLENCNNAYISATVQPRRSYSLAGVYTPYAKHGIELIDSRNVDLSGARVWDWNETNTLWTNGGQYQHLALYGNCNGLILNDFLYYEQPNTDIRDLIYTDTASNLETVNILQEPFTRWFKPKDGVPHFSDGYSEKRLITEEDLDAHFDTDIVKGFTDVLSIATDTDGSVFKDKGYGYGIVNANGTYTDGDAYKISTGFIPIEQGQTLYAEGVSFNHGDDNSRVVLYNDQMEYVMHVNRGILLQGNNYYAVYTETENGFSIRIAGNAADNVAYIRLVFQAVDVSDRPFMAIDEEIKYVYEGFLADSVKVKAENIVSDLTASVGQTIVVKEVDEVGRPTAWETADFPEGEGGFTKTQVNALDGLFKIATYKEDASSAYAAFKTAFGLSGSGGGDTPDVTLTSISATYGGGEVAVGTALTDLTGIVVTAYYSDGSTETVTDYTLAGTIAEGVNTITVSYGDLTATFTVTGVKSGSSSVNVVVSNIVRGTTTFDERGFSISATNNQNSRATVIPVGQYLEKGKTYKFSIGDASTSYYYGVQVMVASSAGLTFELVDGQEVFFDTVTSRVVDTGWMNTDYEYTVPEDNMIFTMNFKNSTNGALSVNDYATLLANVTIKEV